MEHKRLKVAPYLKEEHLDVFDCANKCGKDGERFIHYMGHVRMMAAAQPFISGAISKTVNMPNEATIEDIEDCYFEAAKIGVKAIAFTEMVLKLLNHFLPLQMMEIQKNQIQK